MILINPFSIQNHIFVFCIDNAGRKDKIYDFKKPRMLFYLKRKHTYEDKLHIITSVLIGDSREYLIYYLLLSLLFFVAFLDMTFFIITTNYLSLSRTNKNVTDSEFPGLYLNNTTHVTLFCYLLYIGQH